MEALQVALLGGEKKMLIDLTLDARQLSLEDDVMDERTMALFKSGHFGSHIDVPLKTEIPLDYMVSRGVLFDVSHIKNRDIDVMDIDLNFIQANDGVLFKTDRIKEYSYGSKEYFHEHPELSHCLIDALILKKIRIIGIDASGVRRGVEHVAADKRCEEKGIYIIENIQHLDRVKEEIGNIFQMHLMWVNFPGKTGLPCRIVAQSM